MSRTTSRNPYWLTTRKNVASLIAAALFVFGSSTFAANLSPEEKQELDDSAAAWDTAFNAHDAKALAQKYTTDAEVIVPGEKVVKGREAVEKRYVDIFKKHPKIRSKSSVVSRRVLAEGVIIEDGTWVDTGLTDAGAATTGRYSSILVKQGGKWLGVLERIWPDPSGILAAEDKQSLDDSLAVWITSFNNHDAAGAAGTYSENTDVMAPDGKRFKGRDAVKKDFVDTFKKNPNIQTKILDVSRRLLAPGVVVEDGVWEETGRSGQSEAAKGRYLSILVRQDGKWLVVHERGWVLQSAEKK